MRIKDGFELRDVCGESVIVATGRKNIDFSKVISLNESAALMWREVVGRDFDVEDLVKVLTDNYEVDEATAKTDAETLVAQWREIGLVD
ncbi:MAG: PqqD family protein [Bacteroidaceae bacterium]|nr:PqqD family protein [Bacteroidaceae bacterium]